MEIGSSPIHNARREDPVIKDTACCIRMVVGPCKRFKWRSAIPVMCASSAWNEMGSPGGPPCYRDVKIGKAPALHPRRPGLNGPGARRAPGPVGGGAASPSGTRGGRGLNRRRRGGTGPMPKLHHLRAAKSLRYFPHLTLKGSHEIGDLLFARLLPLPPWTARRGGRPRLGHIRAL